MKILHVLDHSLPYITDYSLRTGYIIKYQKELGLKPLAITSINHSLSSNPIELIGGIAYYRTFLCEDDTMDMDTCPFRKERVSISAIRQAIDRLLENQKIDLIHAHSPLINGLAALEISCRRGTPFLYEIHDADEDKSFNEKEDAGHSLDYSMSQSIESYLFQQAGAIIVPSEDRRGQIIKNGFPKEKVYTIPSNIEISAMQPIQQKGEKSGNKYNLEDHPLLNFIGSLFQGEEGVVYLLKALAKSAGKISKAHPLWQANQDKSDHMRSSCQEAWGHIIYVGQVNSKNITRRYSMVDILLYPQLDTNQSHGTSLRPQLKSIQVNEINNLREVIINKNIGLCFKSGDISDLAGKCLKLIMNNHFQHNLNSLAIGKIEKDRKWLQLMAQYLKVYKNILTQ